MIIVIDIVVVVWITTENPYTHITNYTYTQRHAHIVSNSAVSPIKCFCRAAKPHTFSQGQLSILMCNFVSFKFCFVSRDSCVHVWIPSRFFGRDKNLFEIFSLESKRERERAFNTIPICTMIEKNTQLHWRLHSSFNPKATRKILTVKYSTQLIVLYYGSFSSNPLPHFSYCLFCSQLCWNGFYKCMEWERKRYK